MILASTQRKSYCATGEGMVQAPNRIPILRLCAVDAWACRSYLLFCTYETQHNVTETNHLPMDISRLSDLFVYFKVKSNYKFRVRRF
jgi:hypothetical protein